MEDEKNKITIRGSMVNEPMVSYIATGQKRMAFFSSFEDAAEADYEFYRSLSPEHRLSIHYELSIRFFGEPQINGDKRFTF